MPYINALYINALHITSGIKVPTVGASTSIFKVMGYSWSIMLSSSMRQPCPNQRKGGSTEWRRE